MGGQQPSSETVIFEVLWDDDNVRVGLECMDDVYYIHFDMVKWTKASYMRLLAVLKHAEKVVKNRGYTQLWAYYPKENTIVNKLCIMFGYIPQGEVENYYLEVKEL